MAVVKRVARSLLIFIGLVSLTVGAFGAGYLLRHRASAHLVLQLDDRLGTNAADRPPVVMQSAPQPPDVGPQSLYINGHSSAINAPEQHIIVSGAQVDGPIIAASVTASDSVILGDIEATDSIVLRRTRVEGGIGAASLHLDPPEGAGYGYYSGPYRGDGATEVIGHVRARQIVVHEASRLIGLATADTGRVDVYGRVDGDIVSDTVYLHGAAAVSGDVSVASGIVYMAPSAQLSGKVLAPEGVALRTAALPDVADRGHGPGSYGPTYPPAPFPHDPGPQTPVVVYRTPTGIFGFLNWLLLWPAVLLAFGALVFLAYGFARPHVAETITMLEAQPGASIVAGLIGSVIVAAVGALLAVTIIGIPLAAALTLAVAGGLVIGIAAMGEIVGRRIGREWSHGSRWGDVTRSLVGTGVVAHLIWIPILGMVALAFYVVMGFGAVLRLWWPRLRDGWRGWWGRRRERRQARLKERPG